MSTTRSLVRPFSTSMSAPIPGGRGNGPGGTSRITEVFLLAGQSNMAGRADFDGGQLYPTGVMQYTRAGTLVAATPPLDHHSPQAGSMGLSLQFAIDYTTARPNRDLVLLPAAQGGSGFADGHWNSGDDLYEDLVARANTLFAENPTFRLAGILWQQGEADSKSVEAAEAYGDRLAAMVASLRNDVTAASATTPFVCGGLLPSIPVDAFPYSATVQDTLKEIQTRLTHVAFASSDGLTDIGDDLHFDAASLRLLGGRFHTALSDLNSELVDAEVDHVETEAIGHWMFGADNPNHDGQAGNSLNEFGDPPALSDGYMTLAPGHKNGLLSDLEEPQDMTMCMAIRMPTGGLGVISGGAMRASGSPGSCSFVIPPSTGHIRCNTVNSTGGITNNDIHAAPYVPGSWFFVAWSHASTGEFVGFKSHDGGNVVTTGSAPRAINDAGLKLAVGDVHFVNEIPGFDSAYDIAEMVYFDTALSSAEIGQVFARSASRLAVRGIALSGEIPPMAVTFDQARDLALAADPSGVALSVAESLSAGQIWQDVSATTSTVIGDPVGQWGQALQAGGLETRPTLGLVDGHPAIVGDGVDDCMDLPFVHSGSELYLAAAVRPEFLASNSRLVSIGLPGDDDWNDDRFISAISCQSSGVIGPNRGTTTAYGTPPPGAFVLEVLSTTTALVFSINGTAPVMVPHGNKSAFETQVLRIHRSTSGVGAGASALFNLVALRAIPDQAARQGIREALAADSPVVAL
ncbi:protein of unknown function (DUF303) [Aliiruegeria haliotis]|uniref:Sialate O-acetylesterase domain-containing protein n=1 Tax=Aliiruegeria haliotis TaxID=1280846 RepID=A0A2T0RUP7_9RHOB|nr:sialate O-acetylesterase [Aliiruegeria haliotis]PRY24901.1 protein of unknown function (DUF303) [Aliiruegeria haliotis]